MKGNACTEFFYKNREPESCSHVFAMLDFFGEGSREVELTAEAVSAATAAQEQDNPDKIASVSASAATTAAAVITAESASAATAAENENQPDTVKSASSISTSTSTVTTAVCCCYITHVSSSI